MIMTPRNMGTADFLALAATAPTTVRPLAGGELVVKVYNYGAWKWEAATDAAIIEAATAAAASKVRPYMAAGERIYTGDLFGKRVCVEAK